MANKVKEILRPKTIVSNYFFFTSANRSIQIYKSTKTGLFAHTTNHVYQSRKRKSTWVVPKRKQKNKPLKKK